MLDNLTPLSQQLGLENLIIKAPSSLKHKHIIFGVFYSVLSFQNQGSLQDIQGLTKLSETQTHLKKNQNINMNTFHLSISLLIHISMAIRGAEKPHNNSTTWTTCFSSRAPGSAGSYIWYYQDPICASCGLQGARGKGLMRGLWHLKLGFPGPYRNRKQPTYSCLPVEENKAHTASEKTVQHFKR